MAEHTTYHVWAMRALFVGLGMLLIFLHLLPLNTVPQGWAGPDIMLAFTFAWVLRRPDYVPPVVIALLFLMGDLLYQRPPGLWSALVLIGSEALRARGPGLRDLTFPVEWLSVATTLVCMTLGYRVILGLLLIDQPPLGLSLMQLVMTLVLYPWAVLMSHHVFGVRKIAPGDIGTAGTR